MPPKRTLVGEEDYFNIFFCLILLLKYIKKTLVLQINLDYAWDVIIDFASELLEKVDVRLLFYSYHIETAKITKYVNFF